MFEALMKSIFGSRNERLLKQYRKTVAVINALEPSIQQLTDEQIKAKTPEFRERLAKGETLAQILPIARFADDWQGRWLFRANPLRSPAKFTAGAVLALALRFVAPALLLTFAIVLVIARGHLVDVAFATLAAGNLVLFGVGLSERGLPFTQKFSTSGQGGNNIARGMLLLLLAGLVAGVQVALSASAVAMLIGIAGASALLVLQSSVFASHLRRPADVRIDWVDDDASGGRKRADR